MRCRRMIFLTNIWIKSSECPAFRASVQIVFVYRGDQRRHRQTSQPLLLLSYPLHPPDCPLN